MSKAVMEQLRAYANRFEELSPDNLDALEGFFAPGARFKDPFNDVVGWPAIRRVFEHMFQTTVEARFHVREIAATGRVGYLSWDFEARRRGGRRLRLHGVSRVELDEALRVRSHVDHWDAAAQVYEKLPLIGALLRRIRARLEA